MSFKQHMQPRQRSQFQVVGEFIYVESCSDTVLIQTERGEYRLKPGAQVLDSQLSGRVTVENLGEAGNVEIICGFGQYIPPQDGQTVTVSQMPPVAVESLPAVTVKALPSVAVEALPKVQLETGQMVRVYATTALLTKPVGGATVETSVLTITSGQAELLANSSRCHVLLKASASNTDVITIGNGFTLSPGEKQQIDTFGGLMFSGTDNNTIEIIEVIR
ncbi:hypothetical protein [Photobacterium lipolyticum]|uniref:Uncharacterized protein n=1 Tax=Photobacterium lipolyticum TaxID=266810 RepID=A0A2T3N245_9GAMM|nr:hypothetical protein [Photobacterium lipolyticum]PSW06264.1 hypothetical protein C9I89_07080 [Photobacterium lipolyticum]